MTRRTAPRLLLLLAAVALAGCTLGPDYRRPEVPLPDAWQAPAGGPGSLADLGWWELFEDPALQALVRTALEGNADLRVAVARVLEARALLGVTRADQFPEVDNRAAADTRRQTERGSMPLPRTVDPESEHFRTTLDLLFEIDLWGRLRRATEAARAEVLASEAARRAVVTTLVGDVAQAYFSLRALDRERDIAVRTLESRRESLRLVALRFREGLTSELDLRRAESEAATAAAAIPLLEQRIAQTEHRLAVLVGRNPGAVVRGRELTEQPVPPAVPAGLPSALLERRPDLVQAEQRLVAANARIGEAKAAFFPQIRLTGVFGVESAELSDLFTGPARVWQLGPSVTIPIFNAGRNQARLDATEARRAQALALYEGAVQQAFREVEDALVAHWKTREARRELEALVAAARRTLELADLRYRNGLANFLEVQDPQRQLFAAELALAQAQRDQLLAVVQLYKALGGGWTAADGPGPRAAR
jgi:multidrug efflux system outer membrane protein